jgi:hypothetical protein
MVENKCDEHKMISQEVTDLKKSLNDIGKILSNKVNIGQMWAVVVLFIMISMAIIGWLWHGQISVRDRLEIYQNTLTGISPDGKEGILIRMDKKLDGVTMALGQHMRDHGNVAILPDIKKESSKK